LAKRTDKNQREIVAALRKIGCSVYPTHMVGHGFVDLVAGFRGKNFLLEIKDGSLPPSRKKLTTDEKLFHFGWRGEAKIVYSAEEAIAYVTR
jgi:Holliday junction resolvase